MTIATLKNEIKDLKNALNTPLDEKLKAKLREQLSISEKTLAEMESAKTPTAKKNATKKANVVAKKSTSVLQKIKKANKKVEPKKATPKKATTAKKPSVLQQLKSKIKLTKNLSGYKNSGIDLVRDSDRPALPMGKRISKNGNVYYENRLNRVDIKQPPKRYPKLEDGGMMAKGGMNEYFSKQASMKGGIDYYSVDINTESGDEIRDLEFKSYSEAMEVYEKYKKSMKYNGDTIEDIQLVCVYKNGDYDSIGDMMANGGMMAKGGETEDYFDDLRVYVQGVGEIYQGKSMKVAIASAEKYLKKNPKAEIAIVDEKYGDEYDLDGNMKEYAKGGRLKSAIMRDRAYKSNEPHEQAYTRKTRPKNPKYNYGFFADGGQTEMHRAYAMGGVLQHGLETGDFIVSHDEGKMVVMNGGSKYEVNIHSGSRTKID